MSAKVSVLGSCFCLTLLLSCKVIEYCFIMPGKTEICREKKQKKNVFSGQVFVVEC